MAHQPCMIKKNRLRFDTRIISSGIGQAIVRGDLWWMASNSASPPSHPTLYANRKNQQNSPGAGKGRACGCREGGISPKHPSSLQIPGYAPTVADIALILRCWSVPALMRVSSIAPERLNVHKRHLHEIHPPRNTLHTHQPTFILTKGIHTL